MIKELIKLATSLDQRGLVKEADALDGIIRKMAEDIFEHKNTKDNMHRFKPSPNDPNFYTRSHSFRWQHLELMQAQDMLAKGLELSKRLEEGDLSDVQRRGIEMDLNSAILGLETFTKNKGLRLRGDAPDDDESLDGSDRLWRMRRD